MRVLHLRLVVPAGCADAVVAFLVADPRVTNVVVLPGASRDPVGDAIQCDAAREGASDVLDELRRLGLDDAGSVAIEEVAASPSHHARTAEAAAPGSPDDGVVWDLVLDRAHSDARSSWSFYAFMALATAIAAIAVVLDSAILVVGAMVVGPEFGAVAAIATGLVLGAPGLTGRGLRLLAQGFAFAIAVTATLALAARAADWIDPTSITGDRPLTGFIWNPDRWSFVVALLAGVAGTLSLTAGRSNALVGVFISVTTIPAAGNLALALALWVPHELGGAAAQLAINIAGMALAGALTLVTQRVVWGRFARREPR
jgi:uncharacterized hydrophobic protein (TIGR00271 family)